MQSLEKQKNVVSFAVDQLRWKSDGLTWTQKRFGSLIWSPNEINNQKKIKLYGALALCANDERKHVQF